MKKCLLLLAAAFSLSAQGQVKEGKVLYQRTMQMNPMRFNNDLPAEVQSQLDKMPRSRTDQFELLFTPEHQLYQFLPNAADDGSQTVSGGGVFIQMRGPANEVVYTNFAAGNLVEQREVMERNFVVTDTVLRLKWKLSEETKPLLNFTARKATATTVLQRPRMTMENGEMKREMLTDTVNVVAWFTTEVPVPAGPQYAGQLPGLILELDVNNGRNVITAIEFSPKVAVAKIKAPSDGKKITAAEFGKERDKIMEEMRRNRPAGRDVIRMQ